MATLDKKHPYGEVSGSMEDGTRYFQDDKRFDVNGDEIIDPSAPKPVKKGKVPAAVAVDSTADLTDDQFAAQLKG